MTGWFQTSFSLNLQYFSDTLAHIMFAANIISYLAKLVPPRWIWAPILAAVFFWLLSAPSLKTSLPVINQRRRFEIGSLGSLKRFFKDAHGLVRAGLSQVCLCKLCLEPISIDCSSSTRAAPFTSIRNSGRRSCSLQNMQMTSGAIMH